MISVLRRGVQIPVNPAFAMTVNKAQGQTLKGMVGVYLNTSPLSHGQLYVAASRSDRPDGFLVLIPGRTDAATPAVTKDIVWPDVLDSHH